MQFAIDVIILSNHEPVQYVLSIKKNFKKVKLDFEYGEKGCIFFYNRLYIMDLYCLRLVKCIKI